MRIKDAMNTPHTIPALPVLPDDDSALLAYLCKLEADERVREFSEEYL